ncbi:MAG: histidine kinase [Deltaproteobacteria bacterium]|nr:MAG: histidine kinase [Deltaproteobacteria bacterium]
MEQHHVINVAIVGGGPSCKAIMDMIFAEKLSQLHMKLIGVADTNPQAVGYCYAREKGIYTTQDYRDLYKLKDLHMIVELTGRNEVANDIYRTRPDHVSVMDHVAARLFWDIFQIEEETIARRQRADKALRESEAKYRSLFESSIDAVCICSKDGYFIDINSAAVELFGYAKKEELPTKIDSLYANPSDSLEFMSRIQRQGFLKDYPVDLRKKDGTILHTLITATLRRDKDDRVIGYQGIIRDVTAKKRNEEKLKRSLENLRRAMGATIQAMALTVETRDPYTAGHQRRVANLARAIAKEMGLSQDQIDGIRMAGIIHDLGKISVPAEILSKPTQLTEIEYSLIKTHPQVGYDILKMIDFPWPVAEIVLQHHERIGGSGYPQGLYGDEVLLEAKILAVADVVEAMASHRPYRPAHGIDKALEEISKNRGILYDPEVVDACLKLFTEKGFKFEQ